MSFSVRTLVSLSALLGIAALSVGVGCAAPSEDVGEGAAALNANGESGDFYDWTIDVAITRQGQNLVATANLTDDDASSELPADLWTKPGTPRVDTRNAGVCLVTDLGLGKCDTVQDCEDAAVAAGIPTSAGAFNPGTPSPTYHGAGYQHFCVAAGSEGKGTCWTRPGPAQGPGGFCSTATGAKDGTSLTVSHASPDDGSSWTALGCLASYPTAGPGPVLPGPRRALPEYDCARQTGWLTADHFIKAH